MSQKLIQDILVNKKSIRMVKKDGVFPSSNKSDKKDYLKDIKKDQEKETKKSIISPIKKESDNFESLDISPVKISKNSQRFLWSLSILSVAVVFFLISSNFSTATLTIVPKSQDIVLDDIFTATATQNTSELFFEVITLKKTSTKLLDTDGEENVERKSVGKAVVYNNYSTTNQRLITNTRLETTDGLVYRIRDSVDVPGYKKVDGKIIPGSIEVEIVADSAGDKYNMKLSDLKGDFKIPGFKGSLKYDGFYARLSADATGGLVGKVKKVSVEKLTSETDLIKKSLKEDLIKELYQKKPEQYEIFKDNYYFDFKNLPDTESKSDKYELREEATVNAIMFKKDNLASVIAKNKIKDFSGEPVESLWSEDISVSIITNTIQPWREESLKVKIVGDTKITWVYSVNELVEYLKGQNKNIINNIVGDKFKSSIVSISAVIRPQWKKTFPESDKRIKLLDAIRNEEVIN